MVIIVIKFCLYGIKDSIARDPTWSYTDWWIYDSAIRLINELIQLYYGTYYLTCYKKNKSRIVLPNYLIWLNYGLQKAIRVRVAKSFESLNRTSWIIKYWSSSNLTILKFSFQKVLFFSIAIFQGSGLFRSMLHCTKDKHDMFSFFMLYLF